MLCTRGLCTISMTTYVVLNARLTLSLMRAEDHLASGPGFN